MDIDYKSLQPDQILATVTRLSRRIRCDFPRSSLADLCEELQLVSRRAKERSEEIRKPTISLRLASGTLVLVIIVGLIGMVLAFVNEAPETSFSVFDFIQVLESALNDVILIGAAIFFLFTLETRIKRNRALDAIHELRSFAHIIDMHQLTKDPVYFAANSVLQTPSEQSLSAHELSRYLDYCSEMLSLSGKVAALYIQHFNDAVAIAAVNEVESLTTGLSGKIWQKLSLLDAQIRDLPRDPALR